MFKTIHTKLINKLIYIYIYILNNNNKLNIKMINYYCYYLLNVLNIIIILHYITKYDYFNIILQNVYASKLLKY